MEEVDDIDQAAIESEVRTLIAIDNMTPASVECME